MQLAAEALSANTRILYTCSQYLQKLTLEVWSDGNIGYLIELKSVAALETIPLKASFLCTPELLQPRSKNVLSCQWSEHACSRVRLISYTFTEPCPQTMQSKSCSSNWSHPYSSPEGSCTQESAITPLSPTGAVSTSGWTTASFLIGSDATNWFNLCLWPHISIG